MINLTYSLFTENRTAEEVAEFDRMLSGDVPDAKSGPVVTAEQQRQSEAMLMQAFMLPAKGGSGR